MKRATKFVAALILTVLFPVLAFTKGGKDNDSISKYQRESIFQYQFVYDRSTGLFKKNIPKWIREGSLVSIKDSNVNPFAIKSNIHFQFANYQYTDGTSTLAKLTGLTGQAQEEANAIDEKIKNEKKSAKAKSATGTKKKGGGKKSVETAPQIVAAKEYSPDADTFAKKVSEINKAAAEINELLSLDETLLLAKNDASILSWSAFKERVCLTVDSDIAKAISAHTLFDYFETRLKLIKADIGKLKAELDKTDLQALNRADPESDLGDQLGEMKKLVADLNTTYTGTNAANMQKKATAIIYNLSAVENAPFEIITESFAANSDIITFSDQLKDGNGNVVRTIGETQMYTYGGHRLNTSIGLAATFGEINGYEYNFKKNPTGSSDPADTGFVCLEESSKNRHGAFNPVIFIHYYPTQKSFCYWRMTAGVGPDFTDLNKTKVYLGGGISFTPSTNVGALSRLGFDVGVAAGYADVLKEKYAGYCNYAQFANVDSKDLVDRALKFGFFAAISFNLSPVKKEQKAGE
jgi:hypothetical protein